MRIHASALLLGAGLFAATSTLAPAQSRGTDGWDDGRPVAQRPSGVYAGAAFAYGRPQGEFGEYVDHGFGGDLHLIYQPGARGILGLRFDLGILNYGNERMRVPLSSTIGGRILVDVNTSNNIAHLGIGPQIGVPDGRFRPYVGGFVGMTYLYTESSVRGSSGDESFARTTNYDDATFSYGGRAGVYVPLRGGPSPISVDLGLVYRNNGEAAYLREGDIIDNGDDTISFTPTRSDTDILSLQLGVSVGIPRSVRSR